MNEEKTISYFYNKDTKTYTISDKEMQKINRKLKERFTLKQENNKLKEVIEEVRECVESNMRYVENDDGAYEPILDGYDIRDILEILYKVKEVKQ